MLLDDEVDVAVVARASAVVGRCGRRIVSSSRRAAITLCSERLSLAIAATAELLGRTFALDVDDMYERAAAEALLCDEPGEARALLRRDANNVLAKRVLAQKAAGQQLLRCAIGRARQRLASASEYA